jgi:hypothetical protein
MPSRKPAARRRSSADRTSARTTGRRTKRDATPSNALVFERHNYVLLGIGLALVVVGYLIMRIDNQVDGFLSLYLAPLLILGGYMEIIYAIMWRPKREAEEEVIVVEAEG